MLVGGCGGRRNRRLITVIIANSCDWTFKSSANVRGVKISLCVLTILNPLFLSHHVIMFPTLLIAQNVTNVITMIQATCNRISNPYANIPTFSD